MFPGCKGLEATQHLQPGQPAIILPCYHSLSVPLSGQEPQWEASWLVAFERVHGPLPTALVDFLLEDLDQSSK